MIPAARHPATREPFTRDELALAEYDARGIFAGGRARELDLLREMGARDPALGRLYEGHFNAVLLVALFGSDEQRRHALRDARAGEFFGVWNTQAHEPVTLAPSGETYRLGGAKTWCSGADTVSRALITARTAGGRTQMVLVPMDRVRAVIDDSDWQPLGMEASNSFRVVFDGAHVDARSLIGPLDAYERSPWFLGGALRFAAVHAGIVERLVHEAFAFLVKAGRHEDPLQVARAGEMRMSAAAAGHWIDAGIAAWEAYDLEPADAQARRVEATADMARLGVERCGLDALELCIRSIGARGLLEPLPFAGLVRDLTMYLRQPAPDATLLRVGAQALRAT